MHNASHQHWTLYTVTWRALKSVILKSHGVVQEVLHYAVESHRPDAVKAALQALSARRRKVVCTPVLMLICLIWIAPLSNPPRPACLMPCKGMQPTH